MDTPLHRSAWLGAGIALLLSLIVLFATGGGTGAQPSPPAAGGISAPSPTLDPVVQGTPAPAAPAQP